ncbi:related to BNA3 - Arylformamidase [Pseudozyma flocculosa]|uniref:Related to BNA3 - Arylformamidase n=1 Tax=Pseudozyma flocculosa TaxID=84751 RepID=A0A5C3FEZ7_9BASI|nr:related to BNA3 - Arylformamidase [Pseudozyma flocculosa]
MASQSPPAAAAATRFRTERSERIRFELEKGADVWSMFNPVVFPTAINLGQGFMNWAPPSFILEPTNAESAKRVDLHHYSHPKGRPRLRNAIADFYSPEFRAPAAGNEDRWSPSADGLPRLRQGEARRLDVETEIQVTSGANGGIYSAMGAFLNHGDEVLIMEPFFDQYEAEVRFHNATPVYIPMLPPKDGAVSGVAEADEWKFDFDLIERKLQSGKVKALLLNTPHNPIGKVASEAELGRLAALCIKHDLLVVSDEVYDCLTFDSKSHLRIAAFEGMWERTITVGSAGKSFACTGWRVGWLIGPDHLIGPARAVHTRITFAVNSTAQEGAAIGLELAPSHRFFETQRADYEVRRAALRRALDPLGLPYTNPHGSYFILVDGEGEGEEAVPESVLKKPRDYLKAWFIAKTCDVVAIPATAFYSDEHARFGDRFVRFSFCKDGQIEEAAQRLLKLKQYIRA